MIAAQVGAGLVILVLVGCASIQAQDPPNLIELECAVHAFALEFGSTKFPSAAGDLHDALNLGNCTGFGYPTKADAIARADKLKAKEFKMPHLAPFSTNFFVATSGSDSAPGTAGAPFKTLARAQMAARAAPKPVLVTISGGKYYVNKTLMLGEADSHVRYTAAKGEQVVLSGGILLDGLDWKPSASNPKIMVADVKNIPGLQSDAEREYWTNGASLSVAAKAPAPPAPPGWSYFPGHCMGDASCKSDHCNCASGPEQLHCFDGSFEQAVSACAQNPYCASFAMDHSRIELFSLNNWSAVPNGDWNSYAKDAASPSEPPPPGPPNDCGGPGPSPPSPPPSPTPPPPPHKWGTPPALWNTFHVGGVRMVRARFPNADPQQTSGKCFSKVQHAGESCDNWLSAHGQAGDQPGSSKVYGYSNGLDRNNAPSDPNVDGGGSYGTFKYTIFDPPAGHPVYNKPMPDWTWTNNSLFSFWGDPLSRPGGVHYGGDITKNYSNPGTGVVHMFHSGLWGGWQYQVVGQDVNGSSLSFSHGGYQEARGSGINSNHYYVENIKEELDVPTEWFHDPVTSQLFFYPNSTDGSIPTPVAPVLSAIFRVEGATNVSFSGITFTETRATYLEQYEVPSGGDWSVHRGAAVEIVDSSAVMVDNCTFNQIGGNGVLLSNGVTDSVVSNSEFVQCGDSAVVAVGSSNGILGTAPTYPRNNIISNNHMHEIGVYGKQTSCYFQALGQATTFSDNLCYNGPRAGINWNDGFAGGSTVSGNLVFNMVRETGDHGPYNSWDRQPYLTNSGNPDGYDPSVKLGTNASILKKPDFQMKNFLINGYNGVWTLDHDDGSQFFNDTMNFMVFGGCKNYLGNRKSCDHNVIVHPGIPSRSSGGRRCQTDDNKEFANQYHDNNHCFTQDGSFYSMGVSDCNAAAIIPHVYETFNNTLYSPNMTFSNGPCKNFSAWQGAGQDRGSVVKDMLSVEEIVAMGKAVLA